ncbi:MAG: MFS transporter [Pseudomonadales bacterium]|nr:MFS transporter [Pseudomonadales bacterium]
MSNSFLPAVFLGSAAFVFLNFGLPIYADEIGLNAVVIGGTYSVFMGTILVVRPLVGIGLDRLGRRWFFVIAFAFYVAAMSVFANTEGVAGLYFARFLQGLGASFMWVTARTMVADLNDESSRGVEMGRLTTTSVRGSMVGAFYGFTLLGFMPLQDAWPIAFAGYAVLSAVAFVWSFFKVGETREVVPATSVEWRFTPELVRVFILVFLTGFASALIEPIYLLYLKTKFDLPMMVLAGVFFPAGIVFAILPRYSGAWSDRLGRGPIIAVGIAFAAAVSMALPFWPSVVLVGASYILFSIGWAMASPAVSALVADLAPDAARGRIIGFQEGAAGLGAALGPLVGGVLYEYVAPTAAFVLNGGILFGAALLAWFWFAEPTSRSARRT